MPLLVGNVIADEGITQTRQTIMPIGTWVFLDSNLCVRLCSNTMIPQWGLLCSVPRAPSGWKPAALQMETHTWSDHHEARQEHALLCVWFRSRMPPYQCSRSMHSWYSVTIWFSNNRIRGLPMDHVTKENAKEIGSLLKELLDPDIAAEDLPRPRFHQTKGEYSSWWAAQPGLSHGGRRLW